LTAWPADWPVLISRTRSKRAGARASSTVKDWFVTWPVALTQVDTGLSSMALAAGLLVCWLEKATTFAPSKNDPMLSSQVAAV
jgi:hypothetical protein